MDATKKLCYCADHLKTMLISVYSILVAVQVNVNSSLRLFQHHMNAVHMPHLTELIKVKVIVCIRPVIPICCKMYRGYFLSHDTPFHQLSRKWSRDSAYSAPWQRQ